MEYKYTFGNRLREAREYIGYTQVEMARLVGIGATTILYYETGRTFPDIHMLFHIAELIGCPATWLLGERIIEKENLNGPPWGKGER